MSSQQIHKVLVKSVKKVDFVGSISSGHCAVFDLKDGLQEGELEGLQVVNGPCPDGSLTMRVVPPLSTGIKMELEVGSTHQGLHTVIMFNMNKKQIVSIPCFSEPQELMGPAVIFESDNLHVFDGVKLKTIPQFLQPKDSVVISISGRIIQIFNGKRLDITRTAQRSSTSVLTIILNEAKPLVLPTAKL